LVVVNLYPFKKTVELGSTWEDAFENIDIGGPSMIRSAAKNHKDVSVLVDPSQYQNFLEESKKGELNDSYKAKLALEAFQHTADYDTAISNWIRKERDLQSSKYIESYPLIKTLRYGENPHQKAFWYGLSNIGWNSAEQLQGKDLSYNNLLDLESALSTVLEFGYTDKDELTTDTFASVILKHNNPCGASISNSASQAFLNALECDSVSAFGGIVAFNSIVDSRTAINLKDIFLECVVAPSFDEEALEILKIKKNLRILKLSKDKLPNKNATSTKSIMGGLLVQDIDDSEVKTESWISVTKKTPTSQNNLDLNFESFSYEFTANALVAKKAVDEGNIDIALDIYLNMHGFVLDEGLSNGTENILKDNLVENIIRIYMVKNDFDAGSNFLNNNSIDSAYFHELAGDFYKYFEKNDQSIFHYNKAISFDIDEAQKNIINMKKPTK